MPASTSQARWRELVTAELGGMPFEKNLITRTVEGIDLQPVYTRDDVAGIWAHSALPGEPPFLRGRSPAQGDRPWMIAQEIAAATPTELNLALRTSSRAGQGAVVLRPSRCDWRAPSLPNLAAMSTALAEVNLQAVPIQCSAGADPTPFAALLLAHAADRGFPSHRLSGSLTGDPFAEWIVTGTLPLTLEAHYDSLAGWTRYAAAEAPQLRTIEVDVTPWGDAGATAVQEIAFTLATGAEYFRALRQREIPAAVLSPRFHLRCAIGPQFFMEVAKFRALRALWAQLVSAFGTSPAAPWIHAVTGRWNKSQLDMPVNLLRSTTEGLSAVLGGIDSLHLAPSDAPVGGTDASAQRLALNLHFLLAEEFHFGRPADPAGGSWYVEKLTDDLARAAWAAFQEIERGGGLAAGLRQGRPQELVAEVAAERKRAVTTRRIGLVGTNLFPNPRERIPAPPSPTTPPPAAEAPAPADVSASWPEHFAAVLASVRAGRLGPRFPGHAETASSTSNRIAAVPACRAAAPFEELRRVAEEIRSRIARPLQVFLARIGHPAQYQARAGFSSAFFAAAGFEAIARETFDDANSAARAALASGAPIVVLCSTDETYPQLVPPFATAIKAASRPPLVVMAGQPVGPELAAAYRTAGVDDFIHLRSDLPATVIRLLKHERFRP